MKRKLITFEERQHIESLIKEGLSGIKISYTLGFTRNAVNNEIRRCGGRESYSAEKAEELSKERIKRKQNANRNNFNSLVLSLKDKIYPLVQKGLSFWQIQRELKIPYQILHRVYSSLGIKAPLMSDLLEVINEKVYALEEQVKVLFELLEKK